MDYTYTKSLRGVDFDEAVRRTEDALKTQGFGVLTRIDVRDTLRKKLDVEFPPYVILGACNPQFAHKALQAEPHIGVLLPCNVVVRDCGAGDIEICAVDPVTQMQPVDNPAVAPVATEVRARLQAVLDVL